MNTKLLFIILITFIFVWSPLSAQEDLLTQEELTDIALVIDTYKNLPATASAEQKSDFNALKDTFSQYMRTFVSPEEVTLSGTPTTKTLREYLDNLKPYITSAQEGPLTENEFLQAKLMAEKFNVPLNAPADIEQALKKLQNQVTIYETALHTLPLTGDITPLPSLTENLKNHAQEVRKLLAILNPYTGNRHFLEKP